MRVTKNGLVATGLSIAALTACAADLHSEAGKTPVSPAVVNRDMYLMAGRISALPVSASEIKADVQIDKEYTSEDRIDYVKSSGLPYVANKKLGTAAVERVISLGGNTTAYIKVDGYYGSPQTPINEVPETIGISVAKKNKPEKTILFYIDSFGNYSQAPDIEVSTGSGEDDLYVDASNPEAYEAGSEVLEAKDLGQIMTYADRILEQARSAK